MTARGTELKINVHVEPIGGIHLSQCEFTCAFFVYTNRALEVTKAEMIKVDDDNYIALVDSDKVGTGQVKMKIEVQVPDSDFPDGYRKEVANVCTGITIA